MVNIIIKKGVYLALLACLPALQVQAEIYKCVNKQGKTFYNDKPCPVYDKETQIKAVKDPTNGYVPPAFVKDKVGKGKSVIIGGNASKEIGNPMEKKEAPKDESSSSLNGGNSTMAGSPPRMAPISDSGRVAPTSGKNNKSGQQPNKSGSSVSLPRVELKVEQREY